MNRKAWKISLAAFALVLVAVAVFVLVPVATVDAVPMEGHCSYWQDKRIDYHSSWGPTPQNWVGTKIIRGCGSSEVIQWGQISNYPVTTCTSCLE